MTEKWNQQYLDGQARYFPHEELVRFLGRTYGSCKGKPARNLLAAEIGCGAGGNLAALDVWGFLPYGYDMSEEALNLARQHLNELAFPQYSCAAFVQYTAPQRLPLDDATMDLVIDVQCIQHLNDAEHSLIYSEIARILKPGARFFSVHWNNGDRRDIFPDHPELRDMWSDELAILVKNAGLTVTHREYIKRSYHLQKHYATWTVIEAIK